MHIETKLGITMADDGSIDREAIAKRASKFDERESNNATYQLVTLLQGLAATFDGIEGFGDVKTLTKELDARVATLRDVFGALYKARRSHVNRAMWMMALYSPIVPACNKGVFTFTLDESKFNVENFEDCVDYATMKANGFLKVKNPNPPQPMVKDADTLIFKLQEQTKWGDILKPAEQRKLKKVIKDAVNQIIADRK